MAYERQSSVVFPLRPYQRPKERLLRGFLCSFGSSSYWKLLYAFHRLQFFVVKARKWFQAELQEVCCGCNLRGIALHGAPELLFTGCLLNNFILWNTDVDLLRNIHDCVICVLGSGQWALHAIIAMYDKKVLIGGEERNPNLSGVQHWPSNLTIRGHTTHLTSC